MSLNGPHSRFAPRPRRRPELRPRPARAARGFAARSEDYQISAPAGLRSALLAEMADGPAALPEDTAADTGTAAPGAVVLAVTATGREAEDLRRRCAPSCPGRRRAVPELGDAAARTAVPRSDTVGRRLSVLRRLAHPDGTLKVVVAPIRAVVQPLVAGLGDLSPVDVKVGQEKPFGDVVRELAAAAYARVDMVTHRGEFAVRGGILDVFPPTEDHPVRIEFFGDEVEQMRWFAVADQRSFSAGEDGPAGPSELYAPPCRELLITPAVMSRAAKLKAAMPAAADMLEKIAGGIAVEGMESLAPVLVDAMVPFVDQLPRGSIAVVDEPERVRTRAHDLSETNAEFLAAAWSTASEGGSGPRGPAAGGRGFRLPGRRKLRLARRHPLRRAGGRGVLVVGHLARAGRGSAPGRGQHPAARPRTARLPGRRRRNDGVHRLARARGLARRRRHRRPGPGPAPRRTLPRRRHPLPPGALARGAPAGGHHRDHHRGRRTRLRLRRAQAGPAHRGRPCWAAPAPTRPRADASWPPAGAATSSTRCSSRPATSSCTNRTASASSSS